MKTRVLVVEDNASLAANIGELLEDEVGAEVRLVDTSAAAVEEASRAPFDLAIVDIGLPGDGDGLGLVPRLRAVAPHGEVILVTGNASIESAVTAVRHGAYAYVLKPFDPIDLLALVERALAQVALRHERESLARELASSEALYRGVVETVEQFIVGLDHEGAIVFCNEFALHTTGYRADEVRGKDFATCFVESNRELVRKLIAAAERGEHREERALDVLTRSGGRRNVRWTFTRLSTDAESSPIAVLAVGVDVTERLALERREAENKAMAAMGRLTTALAHEIRNPLNAAKLQLELLGRSAARLGAEASSHRIDERARLVRSELERLSRLLEEFLRLARPRGLELVPVALPTLLDEVVALQTPVAQAAGLALETGFPASLPLVQGDYEKLKQVLINLVGNAIEALTERGHGTIRVEASPLGPEWIEVRVVDDGPGMDPEVRAQIFEPFVTTKAAGTGLGLTVVQRIVELHGGEVALDPRPEGGTVARFTLRTSETPSSVA